jgi:hypothetical protein
MARSRPTCSSFPDPRGSSVTAHHHSRVQPGTLPCSSSSAFRCSTVPSHPRKWWRVPEPDEGYSPGPDPIPTRLSRGRCVVQSHERVDGSELLVSATGTAGFEPRCPRGCRRGLRSGLAWNRQLVVQHGLCRVLSGNARLRHPPRRRRANLEPGSRPESRRHLRHLLDPQRATRVKGDGHLVVVVGFDENGDVIINDPGTRITMRKTVARDRFAAAWSKSHNTVYLIHPSDHPIPHSPHGHWYASPHPLRGQLRSVLV